MREDNLIIEDGEEVVILLEEEDDQETAYIDTKLVNEELNQAQTTMDDTSYEEEIIYEDDLMYEDEIVYEEEPVLDVPPMKASKTVEDTSEYDEEEEDSFLGGIGSKIIIGMGLIVVALAIFMGVFLIKSKVKTVESVDFSNVGNEVAIIGNIGGDNIEAITTAQGARLEELYEAVKSYDYDEADETTGITTVQLTLTSILKDLKIKFVNKKDKLIANVPFQVEVTDPSGKTYTVTDEDKDGIIYLTEIDGGAYKIKLVKLEGYDTLYDFEEAGVQSVSVKSQLDYKKVDISNEIKKATDAVSAKEDTKKSETTVESKLTDTVGYVMSSKTLVSAGYTAVDKASKVTDPMQTLKKTYETASITSRFYRLNDNNNTGSDPNPNGEGGGENKEEHKCTEFTYTPTGDNQHVKKCKEESCGKETTETCDTSSGKCVCGREKTCSHSNLKSVPASTKGKHKTVCSDCNKEIEGSEASCTIDSATLTCSACGYEHKHDYKYDPDPSAGDKHIKRCKNEDGVCPTAASSVSEACTYENGVCKFCKQNKNANFKFSLTLTGDKTISFVKDSTKTYAYKVTSTVTGTQPAKAPTYKWEMTSGAGTTISVPDQVLDKDTITIKPLATGKASLKCRVTYTLDDGSETFQESVVDIEVVAANLTLSHTGKKLLFINGDEITVTATMVGNTTDKLKWVTSDSSAASVAVSEDTRSAKIKAHAGKAGTSFTITVSVENNSSIYQQVTFTVMNNPKEDKATKLLDNDGKQLYVYDSSSKSYREAVYADYYTADKLYTPGGTGGAETYKYTGWWKLDGKTYYFDANGKKVTGDQVINGAKYSFDSDGALKSGTGTFGIDVSVWNGTIDWTKVSKSGVNYAIIRCGFRGSSLGGLYEDSKFAQNISNATKAGIKVGVYFFTQAVTEAEAVEEASMCLSLVNGYNLAYPIFIDVESSGGRADGLTKDQRTAIVNAFCKTITNSGYKAGVYANKNWFENKINASSLTGYTIWLAQYASKATYSQTRYDLWQYSSKGSISGISGDVDLNLSYVGY